jgi:hypothetical protein
MKERISLISNSSSTSYLIRLKGSECPHCHRTGNGLIELLKHYAERGAGNEETGVKRTREEFLAHQRETANEIQERIRSTPWDPSGYYKDHWGIDKREWHEADLAEAEELIRKVNSYPPEDEILQIEISYHDPAAQTLFEEELAAGTIEILEE